MNTVNQITPTDLNLTFGNTMDDLQQAMEQTDAFMEKAAVAPQLEYAIRLTLEELATNIIKYGYDDAGQHHVALSLTLGSPAVMVLTDDGHRFNPLEDAPEPTLDGPLEDRPIGGLGLHMIQAMGMKLDYRRENEHNILNIIFPQN